MRHMSDIRSRSRGRLLVTCLLIIVGFLSLAELTRFTSAQTGVQKPSEPPSNRDGQEINQDDVISIRTSEVLLPVTVRDSNGRLVTDLQRKDFRVFEDGREQPLSDLALRQVPVDVVLMIDTSSSVATYLDDFSRAVEEFAQKLGPEDRISLIKFDDQVELVQDWTQSRFQLRRALRRITPGMFTRFNDALFLAAHEQLQRARVRHAILVLTDGIDSGRGNATIETALAELLKAGVSVYVVSNTQIEQARKRADLDSLLTSTDSVLKFNELRIGDLRESLRVLDLSEHSLGKLADATGGRLYTPDSFDKLDSVYREVAEELRHQYALYYTPLDKTRDGRFRRVKVETLDPTSRVTTRVGYFAPTK
ncbi:MAG TPA: VWA domain-containing protein [Pyrinomonadaceae bacterium]